MVWRATSDPSWTSSGSPPRGEPSSGLRAGGCFDGAWHRESFAHPATGDAQVGTGSLADDLGGAEDIDPNLACESLSSHNCWLMMVGVDGHDG